MIVGIARTVVMVQDLFPRLNRRPELPSSQAYHRESVEGFGRATVLLALVTSGLLFSSMRLKAGALFGPESGLSLDRRQRSAGILVMSESSDGGASRLWAQGEQVSTNRLFDIALGIVRRQRYEVNSEQIAEATRAFEHELPYYVSRGLIRSNAIDVTFLAGELAAHHGLNKGQLVARSAVVENGQLVDESYLDEKTPGSQIPFMAETHNRHILVSLDAVLDFCRQPVAGQTKTPKTAFVERLEDILLHERCHVLKVQQYLNEPAPIKVSQVFDRDGMPNSLRFVALCEWSAQLVSLSEGPKPHQDLIEAFEDHHRFLSLRKLTNGLPIRKIAELYPGYKITRGIAEDKDLAEYLVEEQVKVFAAKTGLKPSEAQLKEITAAAQGKVINDAFSQDEFIGFLGQIADAEMRLWAKGVYEKYFGALPPMTITIPEEVMQWFERKARKDAAPIQGPGT